MPPAHFTAAPTARLFDATGRAQPLTPPEGTPATPAELLRAALAAAPRTGFRLTPEGGLATADPADPPGFETLTGGSTGAPRRVRRSQASWIASFEINRAAWGLGAGSRVATLGALTHSLALYGALEALHCGAALHLLAGLRPGRQAAAALAARAVTLLWATPAQLRLLSGPPMPSLARLLVGGGALDAATAAHARALFPKAAIHAFYGASETSFVTLAGPDTPPGSAGRPYPGVTLELRDTAPDGTGTVWVKSPYLFEGYAGGAPGPARRDARGFVTVHERGRLDAAGNLFLAGRADRAVRIADQTVHPETVEAALLALPGIREAAALPRPDRLRGSVLVAAYIPAPGAPAPEALLARARRALGPLAAPRALCPLAAADWPRLPSGKTDLAALARHLAPHLADTPQ